MKPEIVINQVFERKDDRKSRFRLLWIDEANLAYVIELLTEGALPVKFDLATIERDLDAQLILPVADPFRRLVGRAEADLTPQEIKIRDQAYARIRPLLEKPREVLFDADLRGPLIAQLILSSTDTRKLHRKTIYADLRKYWTRGQVPNALLPNYEPCGGSGPRKIGDKKIGRPNSEEKKSGEIHSVVINDQIRHKFFRAMRSIYPNEGGKELQRTYHLMIEQYFNKGKERAQGVDVPVIAPPSEDPSFWQFQYWVEQNHTKEVSLRRRLGNRRFELRCRMLLGGTANRTFGPGSQFQIDSTTADCYLISRLDGRRLVGRPTIYLVIDTFSHAIVGVYITLEKASYYQSTLAIANAATDKVQFCKALGIEIEDWEWPAHHMPESLVADNGELKGYNSNNLTTAFGTIVINTASYRADWKPIVERCFRVLNDLCIRWLPGHVAKDRERGDPDCRSDALFNIDEFRKLVVTAILQYNRELFSKPLAHLDLIASGAPHSPLEVFSWGLSKRAGSLSTADPATVRRLLLPRETARVTGEGLIFGHLRFTCPSLIESGAFLRPQRRSKVPIAFNPTRAGEVYLVRSNEDLEPCKLLGDDQVYSEFYWKEVSDILDRQEDAIRANEQFSRQKNATLHAITADVTAKALARKKAAGNVTSVLTQEINKNRAAERRFTSQSETNPVSSPTVPPKPQVAKGNTPADIAMAMLLKQTNPS